MGERIEDEDRDALEGLSDVPPPRKSHSYSQQLRAVSGTGHKRHHQVRKHSLDEERIPKHLDRYDESSDDDFFPYASSSAAGTIAGDAESSHRLDLALADDSADGSNKQPLPEFVSGGGGNGVFRVPIRAALHPSRPPALELRPHPLRETQVGKFLRTIAFTDTQLWAGQECGVRVWNFEDAFESGLGGKVKRGDEDAAPFYESPNTSPTMCIVVDLGNRLVFTGHKDGKIRSWKMEHPTEESPFKEGLCWQAHPKGAVVAMVISAHGDLWSGSEGGVIGIWPWESIEKSLSLTTGERHMAALLVERSFLELKEEATASSNANISSEVKGLLSDHARAKVWCARPLSFSLWDARTRKLLKVYNIDGLVGTRSDTSAVTEPSVEDEMRQKFVSPSRKEKSQSSFLQRSRNALMGAADAVRRVATKGTGAFAEDNRRTEALVQTVDGMIWTGCSTGLLIQWDSNGNRLQDVNHHSCAVQCFCALGTRIYVGYVSGTVQVLDLEGKLLAGWVAHNSPVLQLAAGKGYIFSLAAHGGIRGWNIISPGPLDSIIRSELGAKEHTYTRRENFNILIGTWNVGQGRAIPDSLKAWLGAVTSDVGIVVVGLQEVEMGAGFLAMSAAKETVGLEGSAMGNHWQDSIGVALDEGSVFERVGSRQLAGLLVGLWVRKNLRTHVGDIDAAAVPCGFGRAIGNKGAVGLRMRVYDRIMCFVNCHFAAHLEAVNRRNADFDHVYRNMVFNRSSNLHNTAAVGVSPSGQMLGTKATKPESEDTKPELSEADMVVFLGDFNYRLHTISYDEARDFVSQRCFDWLREKDQLRAEMKAGKVFQGMREALIRFPPTYKFERHIAGLGGYDSGEKKRIPAWCDRIIFRDSRPASASECSLEYPVVTSVLLYDACMEVTDSDHKPVRCKLHVELSHADRSVRRKEFGEIVKSNEKIRSMLEELCYVPEATVSTNSIFIQNQDTSILRITNKCSKDKAIFRVLCEGQSTVSDDEQAAEIRPKGSYGFPGWLEVSPAAGIVKPDQMTEVSIRYVEHTLEDLVDGIPQNWWSEDTRDKEVILSVNVQGSRSLETRSHEVRVRHSFSNNKAIRMDSRSNSNSGRKYQGSSQQRSDMHHHTSTSYNQSEQHYSGSSQQRSDNQHKSGNSHQRYDNQHKSGNSQQQSDMYKQGSSSGKKSSRSH